MTICQWMGGIAAAAMILTTTATTQATVVDTTPAWNGVDSIGLFGEPSAATWGQTFTVANSDNILQSFTLYVDDQNSLEPIDFAAYIMAWDDTNMVAIGPVLYQSAQQTTTLTDNFEEYTFVTGGLTLTQGEQYIAFLSASDFFTGNDSSGFLGNTDGDNYAGGTAYLLDNGSDFSQVTTTAWIPPGSTDLAFTANFTGNAVPEPASAALLALGAGVIGLTATRRRQQR